MQNKQQNTEIETWDEMKAYKPGDKFEFDGVVLEVKSDLNIQGEDLCHGCIGGTYPSMCRGGCGVDGVIYVESEIKNKRTKQKNTVKHVSDGCKMQAEVLPDGSVVISAKEGYNSDVSTLCTLEDNGNGYYVSVPSYSSVNPDHVFNIDYGELEYLWLAYKALRKVNKGDNNA